MSSYAVAIIIVGMALAVGAFQIYMDGRAKFAKNSSGNVDLLNRIAALEDRVKTLERINTDPSERLRRQIDDLAGA